MKQIEGQVEEELLKGRKLLKRIAETGSNEEVVGLLENCFSSLEAIDISNSLEDRAAGYHVTVRELLSHFGILTTTPTLRKS